MSHICSTEDKLIMTKVSGLEFDEYKYHNWKLCQLSLDLPLSSLSHSPLEIQVEVTTHCNIKCIMCTRPIFVTRPKHLHPDIISKLYPLFPGAVKVIPFGGGEPLLNPHFKEVVEYAKHCRAQVNFNTNGILLNESLSKTFVSIGVDMITFSIDAVKEGTYQAIRKGSNYSKVINNLTTLAGLKKEYGSMMMIGIAFVPMVDNFREIPELFYLASELGIKHLFFETLISPDRDWNNEYTSFYHQHALSNIPQTELSTYFKKCDALAKKLNLLIYPSTYFSSFYEGQGCSSFQDRATIHRRGIACTLPWTNIYVNADGLVQTCCMSSRVFGDLKVQEFSEIWNGKEFQHYRDQIINQEYPVECRNCIDNGRNRETIPSLTFFREQTLTKEQLRTLTKEQLLSSWKGRTREIINRLYRKLRSPLHR